MVGGALLCSSGSVVREEERRGGLPGTAGTGLRWVPRVKDVVGKSSVDPVVVVVNASWGSIQLNFIRCFNGIFNSV